jgi:two-component system nitrogen regulation sensor histidine kinase NtrY
MDSSAIEISTRSAREKRRRRREFLFAALGVLGIFLLTWAEIKFVGVDSYLFLILFNLNFVLLLAICFVVLRNIFKLLLERRRKVLGSRLRTRLVLAFMTLSLIPTLIMYVISVNVVQTSVDYWFAHQVETSMENALEVGQAYSDAARERLVRTAGTLLGEIREREMAWGGKAMDELLAGIKEDFGLSLVGVVGSEGRLQNWKIDEAFAGRWAEASEGVDWQAMVGREDFWSVMLRDEKSMAVVGLLPVDGGRTGWLALGVDLGEGILARLESIVQGVREYNKLKALKYPQKVALYLSLGAISLLIILGAIWFGFRLAKELSAPIQGLAEGARRIADGDLSVRLQDSSKDELGVLVGYFNRMAEALEHSQAGLRQANDQLGLQYRELEERGAYIEAVLDTITSGVVSLDAAGRIKAVNKAAETMLGLDAAEVIGQSPLELLHGGYAELVREVLAQIERSPGMRWQRQIALTVGSREVKLLVNAVALPPPGDDEAQDAAGGVVAVFEDITELEKMQRLAAWREVARRIAHEIKNPLTPIKLSAQRLERRFGKDMDDAVFQELTGLITRQVEHIQEMVREFSAYAKLPEVVREPGHLGPLVEETVAVFRHSHPAMRWELAFRTTVPEIRFDREALRRVLTNVLTNAAEAVAESGGEEGRIEVDVEHDDILNLVRIEVADNGMGLSEEERSRIFEPYFSRKQGGTGLGLTIVRAIIADHHGYVRVRQGRPRGTVIIIELPTG